MRNPVACALALVCIIGLSRNDASNAQSWITERSRLSDDQAWSFANKAVKLTTFIGSPEKFESGEAAFDGVTRVWQIPYKWQRHENEAFNTFSVFVFDASGNSEVTCLGKLGLAGGGMGMEELPAEVQPFVPSGEKAIRLLCADLNGDGAPDFLLVTKNDESSERTMQVLLRDPEGSLSVAVYNSHAIQPKYEDGMVGGFDLLARKNRIVVTNKSGGRGRADLHTFYFEYSTDAKTWLLTTADKRIFGASDLKPYRKHAKEFGRLTIAEFHFSKFD